MNTIQDYGSDPDDEGPTWQAEASGSRSQERGDSIASEDGEEDALDSSDVFGLNGVKNSDTTRSEGESSTVVRAAPEVSIDVSHSLRIYTLSLVIDLQFICRR
jgi:hypothetical protein